MTLPTVTWRLASMYPFAPAGTNATVAECLAAVKAMLDTESAGSGLWMANAYDGTEGWLEIRRKGTPAGVLGTDRALMFGGTLPNAAACSYACALGSVYLYGGVAQAAATTGPDYDYDTAAPYAAGKRWAGAGTIVTPGTYIAKARTPYVSLIECDVACGIMVCDTNQTSLFLFGEIIAHRDGTTGIWAGMCSGSSWVGAPGNDGYEVWSSNGYPPGTSGNGSTYSYCFHHDGTNRMHVARSWGSWTSDNILWDLPDGAFHPILVGDKIGESGTYTYSLLGTMRQLKLGPLEQNRMLIRDSLGAAQGYAIGHGLGKTRGALFFDQFP